MSSSEIISKALLVILIGLYLTGRLTPKTVLIFVLGGVTLWQIFKT